MKRTVLFGAGQMGAMGAWLLGGDHRIVCFADNAPERQGGTLCGIPILSPEQSLMTEPACFCLCVLDDERAGQMENQLRALGFCGDVLRLSALIPFDARVATMRMLAEEIHARNVPGDVAELGVYRGEFAVHINAAFPDRMLHLFDTFEGFPEQDVATERQLGLSRAAAGDFGGVTQNIVWKTVPYPDMTVTHKGYFPDTFPPCADKQFAFVSIDADLYAPTAAALPLFWERLSPGGAIIVHDYDSAQFPGAGKAVREFCRRTGVRAIPLCDLHASALLAKAYSD